MRDVVTIEPNFSVPSANAIEPLSDVLPASSSDIDSPPDCAEPNWLRAALAPSTISLPWKPLLSPQSFTPPMPEVE